MARARTPKPVADAPPPVELDGDPTPAPVTQSEALAALEHERRGYVARGLTDRVKLVDAEIARARKSLG